jgi:hypothetical protein
MCLATIRRRKKKLKNMSDTVAEEKNNKKYERGEDEGVFVCFLPEESIFYQIDGRKNFNFSPISST